MDTVRDLVKNLTVLVILATFLEMLLPNNNLRKYARLIFGLMVLATILNPIASLLSELGRMPDQTTGYSYIELDEGCSRG